MPIPTGKCACDVLCDYRCMMDSMASEHSKFLPIDSKSVLKFSMPSIVLNDSLSLSSAVEQVKYFGSILSWGGGESTFKNWLPPFFSFPETVHAL